MAGVGFVMPAHTHQLAAHPHSCLIKNQIPRRAKQQRQRINKERKQALLQSQQEMMNNDELRLTTTKLNSLPVDITNRKKIRTSVKLPSVKMIQNETSNYILGEEIGEGGYAKVRMCTRRKDGEKFVVKVFDKFLWRFLEHYSLISHVLAFKLVFPTPRPTTLRGTTTKR